jgi:hypothetical protein
MMANKHNRSKGKGKIYTDKITGKRLTLQERNARYSVGVRAAREFAANKYKILENHNDQLEKQHVAYIEQFKLIRGLVKEAMPELPEETVSSVEAVRRLITAYNQLKAMYDNEVTEDVGHDEEM